MRRLVPLPIDQVRPKLARLREYWTLRARLGNAAGASALLLVLMTVAWAMNPMLMPQR